MTLLLHDYWRSSASYRVRIALNLKGVPYGQELHDLRLGEQAAPAYAALNSQKLVPALLADGMVFTQSPAILEWLEERWPEPALLPAEIESRAIVRAMCSIICCDIHPINNLRVLTHLRAELGTDEAQIVAWIARWMSDGFAALEDLVARHGGRFAYGDRPSLADCVLVPQIFSAERFFVDLSAYPNLVSACEEARGLPAFARAHPALQPGADK